MADRTTPAWGWLAALVGAFTAGCATPGPAADTRAALDPPGGVGPSPIAHADESPSSPAPWPAEPAPAVPADPPVQADADTPRAEPATESPGAPRPDGRPVWWLDEAQRVGGEVVITAEALGADLRSARRAAVDAGLARLARELGGEPARWEVRAATVRPLRAIRAPGEVHRFAGYVLIAGTP